MAEVERIEIHIEANTQQAIENLQKLNSTLAILREKVGDGENLKKIAKNISAIGKATLPDAEKINSVADSLQRMQHSFVNISSGTNAYTITANRINTTNTRMGDSFRRLAANISRVVGLHLGGMSIYSTVKESSQYVEALNLFTASMGKYADKAGEFADKVSSVMGIDPAQWMRYQGVFMTLASGFGIAGDRAEVMSQQMTQLTYDKRLSLHGAIRVEEQGEPRNLGCAA